MAKPKESETIIQFPKVKWKQLIININHLLKQREIPSKPRAIGVQYTSLELVLTSSVFSDSGSMLST